MLLRGKVSGLVGSVTRAPVPFVRGLPAPSCAVKRASKSFLPYRTSSLSDVSTGPFCFVSRLSNESGKWRRFQPQSEQALEIGGEVAEIENHVRVLLFQRAVHPVAPQQLMSDAHGLIGFPSSQRFRELRALIISSLRIKTIRQAGHPSQRGKDGRESGW